MCIINRNNYSREEILDVLYQKSGRRKISFRFDLLNKNEIKIGEIMCRSARISYGENRAIMRSAVFEVRKKGLPDIDFLSDKLRPWFVLHMEYDDRTNRTVEWPLGVFLLHSPRFVYRDGEESLIIGAYDKTIILDEDRFTRRFFISKGSSYVGRIEQILASSGIPYSRIAQSDKVFGGEIEFPTGMKKRDAVNELLSQMNYSPIFADEDGILCSFSYVNPADRQIDLSYSSADKSILHTELEESVEFSGRANVFTRVAFNFEREELHSTFVNSNPENPFSTIRRGRNIVDFQQLNSINDQDSLDALTKRAAIENSFSRRLKFKTLLMPGHGCFKTLYLNIPEILDTPGKFAETAWEMDLSSGGASVMTHEARRIVRL